ncbi:MAG: recombinase family protein [Alphaproteobacteria bacterium]|nr:recombinase family protein [Alphaproteobacteria bacterium]
MMIYGYCRCSTEKRQTCSNQHFAIQKYAEEKGIHIDKWIEENISSRKPLHKRELGRLMEKMTDGDTIIITEISRLARNLYELAGILQNAINENVKIISIKENYSFSNDLQSKIMAYTFGLAAEIERDLISTRIKYSLDKLKQQNVKLGRPLGSGGQSSKLEKYKEKIKNLLGNGVTQVKISQILGVHPTTMCRYLKRSHI